MNGIRMVEWPRGCLYEDDNRHVPLIGHIVRTVLAIVNQDDEK